MIVCIGDSVTAAQYVEPELGWVSLLGFTGAGVPGDTTRLGLERFHRDVQVLEPERVLIQFGHNDANRWQSDRGLPRVSLAAYRANLVEMIERARTFGGLPLLLGMTRPVRDLAYVADCERYDEAGLEVARETGTAWCPMWPHFAARHFLDGLHLNPEGHRRYAERVASCL
jgi:lysophospholipase L1-like esterase